MAGTFEDFIASPDRQEIVLAELTPSFVTVGFTAVGVSAPNTYQLALPRFVQTAQVVGGLYRRCVGVRENGTDLTERASIALVDASAGSWFWDEPAGVLYVRTTGGGSPDTYTAYQAFVTFYVATTSVALRRVDGDPDTAVYYHPWMSGPVPGYVSEVEDILFGQKLSPSGELALTNGHGAWHTIVAPDGEYSWKNKRVRFYIGGRYNGLDLMRSQYAAIVTMQVEDVAPDEERCVFQLKPLARQTELELPITPYFETDYPNLGDGVRGTRKWIGYGRTTMRPDLTDTVGAGGLGIWTIADAQYQSLAAVHAVTAIHKSTGVRVGISDGVDYVANLGTCTIQITNPTYIWSTYNIEVDVTGKTGGIRGYLSTFSEIVKDILVTFLGVPLAEIDTAAFDKTQADAPEELSLWIKSPRSIASLLSTAEQGFASLERSVMGTVQQTLGGLWTCWIWDPGYDAATIVSLRKEDFASFRPQPKLETIFGTTYVHFNFNHATEEWPIEEQANARVQFLSDTRERADIFTFLRSASDAKILAQRFQLISGAVSMEIEFTERGAKLARELAGGKVLITYDPAPTAIGKYESRAFEILRLEKGYAPTITIAGRFGDLRGIGATIGHWQDDTAPDWASATPEQRAKSGFWTNDAGEIVPGDPTTAGLSRWF